MGLEQRATVEEEILFDQRHLAVLGAERLSLCHQLCWRVELTAVTETVLERPVVVVEQAQTQGFADDRPSDELVTGDHLYFGSGAGPGVQRKVARWGWNSEQPLRKKSCSISVTLPSWGQSA